MLARGWTPPAGLSPSGPRRPVRRQGDDAGDGEEAGPAVPGPELSPDYAAAIRRRLDEVHPGPALSGSPEPTAGGKGRGRGPRPAECRAVRPEGSTTYPRRETLGRSLARMSAVRRRQRRSMHKGQRRSSWGDGRTPCDRRRTRPEGVLTCRGIRCVDRWAKRGFASGTSASPCRRCNQTVATPRSMFAGSPVANPRERAYNWSGSARPCASDGAVGRPRMFPARTGSIGQGEDMNRDAILTEAAPELWKDNIWDRLLDSLDERCVIPIVGRDLLQVEIDGTTILLERLRRPPAGADLQAAGGRRFRPRGR